jgi:hypothetical protein
MAPATRLPSPVSSLGDDPSAGDPRVLPATPAPEAADKDVARSGSDADDFHPFGRWPALDVDGVVGWGIRCAGDRQRTLYSHEAEPEALAGEAGHVALLA